MDGPRQAVLDLATDEPAGHARGRWRHRRLRPPQLARRHWLVVCALAFQVAALMTIHGQLPFLIASPDSWYTTVGSVRCGALSVAHLLQDSCPVVGGAAGAAIGNGLPIVVVATGFVRLVGLPAEWALTTTYALMMTAAAAGAWMLARDFGIRLWIAYAAGFAYLISPTVVGMQSFGSTFWGVLGIPMSVWFSRRMLIRIATARTWSIVIPILCWASFLYVLIYLDGYAFVMVEAAVIAVLAGSALAMRATWPIVRMVTGQMSATVLAYGLYRATSASGTDFAKSSIDLFRAMGADVVTLMSPTSSNWWAGRLGVARDFSLLWGDGTNSRYNYLGVVLVALSLIGVVLAWRTDRRMLVWLVVGAAALLLALGPSIKISDVRGPLVPPITYQSYLMPAHDAALSLPTEWLYQHAPGLDMMRATYRWMALVRLSLVMLGAFAVQQAVAHRRWWAVVGAALGLIGLLELAPDAPNAVAVDLRNAHMIARFDADVIAPLDNALPDRSRVIIAPNAAGGNDFLAGYIATGAHLWMYNVGGDKSVSDARKTWPAAVTGLLTRSTDFADSANGVLEGGMADCVVIPYFDLRWSATAWPTSPQFAAAGREAVLEVATDGRFMIQRYDSFAIATLREP